jgi:hypothetical protein
MYIRKTFSKYCEVVKIFFEDDFRAFEDDFQTV